MYDLYKSVMINHVSKKHVCAAALFLCLCADLFSQSKNNEFYLQNVPSAYIGTYIPVQYDNILKKTRSHYAALFSNDGNYHDVLYVQKHICYSDLRFHDGYAITAAEFNSYSFITKKSGMYIIDGNGNSYKKIGANHDYIDVCQYVVNLIFEDALQLKNVELTSNATIIINDIEFDPVLDPVFFETDSAALWLRSEHRGLAALKRKESGAALYKVNDKVDERDIYVSISDTVEFDFPMFYWKDAAYPHIYVWNLTKKDLRYMRNLIFAKHGYIFKSADLKAVFDNFKWYKENPAFSETLFSEDEQKMLNNIKRAESQK